MKASDKTAPSQALGCKVKQKKRSYFVDTIFSESQLNQSLPASSAVTRGTTAFLRVEPQESHAASLFLNKRCCQGVQKFPF